MPGVNIKCRVQADQHFAGTFYSPLESFNIIFISSTPKRPGFSIFLFTLAETQKREMQNSRRDDRKIKTACWKRICATAYAQGIGGISAVVIGTLYSYNKLFGRVERRSGWCTNYNNIWSNFLKLSQENKKVTSLQLVSVFSHPF